MNRILDASEFFMRRLDAFILFLWNYLGIVRGDFLKLCLIMWVMSDTLETVFDSTPIPVWTDLITPVIFWLFWNTLRRRLKMSIETQNAIVIAARSQKLIHLLIIVFLALTVLSISMFAIAVGYGAFSFNLLFGAFSSVFLCAFLTLDYTLTPLDPPKKLDWAKSILSSLTPAPQGSY